MSCLHRCLLTVGLLAAGCAPLQPRPVTFRVLSYNIHHGEGLDGRLDLERIARVIRDSQADLVALQEVDRNVPRTGRVDQPAELARLTGLTAIFEKNIDLNGGEYGNAILSRFPIETHTNHLLPTQPQHEQRGAIEAQVSIGRQTLTFIATHFQAGENEGERVASALRLGRLASPWKHRPVILAGDLNARPGSRPQYALTSTLLDSCVRAGPEGCTFPADAPNARIDYILSSHNAGLKPTESVVWPEKVASDHRPVLATFELAPASQRPRAEHVITLPDSHPAWGIVLNGGVSLVDELRFPKQLMRWGYMSMIDGFEDWALVLPSNDPVWIVMIHGHGATGDQLFTRPDIRDAWLPLFRAHYGIITVNLRGNAWMSPAAAADLHSLLYWMQIRHGHRRFIFASGSMGGTSNLIYAALHPEDVAGVVALCPATDLASYDAWTRQHEDAPVLREIRQAIETAYGGSPEQRAEVYREHSALANRARLTMPVFVGHGSADAIIPVEQSRALAQAMAARPNFRYVEVEGGGHDAPLAQMRDALEWVSTGIATTQPQD